MNACDRAIYSRLFHRDDGWPDVISKTVQGHSMALTHQTSEEKMVQKGKSVEETSYLDFLDLKTQSHSDNPQQQ